MSKAPAGWVPLQGPTWGLWPVSPPPPSTEDEDVLRTRPAQTLLQLAPGSSTMNEVPAGSVPSRRCSDTAATRDIYVTQTPCAFSLPGGR